MKTACLSSAILAALGCIATLNAQTPVSTGTIQAVGKEEGTLTLRANQALAAPLIFHGMDKAKIETASGKVATLADLAPGVSATVHYAQRDNRWYVARVVIEDPTAAVPATGTGTAAARQADPATDDDITTRPGQGAPADRTVRPPKTDAATDGDITTERGSTSTNIRQTAP